MEPWHWNLIFFALVMTCSGFMQSCAGFGYAAVALSLLPYFMDIRLGNLAVSLSAVAPMVVALWVYRSQLDWSALGWALAGATLLLPVGLWAFTYLPTDLLVRGTGLTILLIMLRQIPSHSGQEVAPTRRWGCASAGAVSGFLAGAVGIGGPPIAAYAIRQPWSPARFKAFVLGFLLVESIVKVIGVVSTGWVDRTVMLYSLLAIPFAMAGGRLGVAAAYRMDPQRFRRIVTLLLIAASLGMVIRGSGQAGAGNAAPGNDSFDQAPSAAVAHAANAALDERSKSRATTYTVRP